MLSDLQLQTGAHDCKQCPHSRGEDDSLPRCLSGSGTRNSERKSVRDNASNSPSPSKAVATADNDGLNVKRSLHAAVAVNSNTPP